MPEQAKVASVEALESFRASLILYLSRARPTLEEVSGDVLRTRLWLQDDQRVYWEGQLRRRGKLLEAAQQTLYSAELASLREPSAAERMAVRKAKQAFDEAEAKLKLVKKWGREFDSRVEPMARHLERLHTILSNTLPQAIAHLGNLIKTLDDYTGATRPTTADGVAEPTGEGAAGGMIAPQEPADLVALPDGGQGVPTGGNS